MTLCSSCARVLGPAETDEGFCDVCGAAVGAGRETTGPNTAVDLGLQLVTPASDYYLG